MSCCRLALKPSVVLLSAAMFGVPAAHAEALEKAATMVVTGEKEPGDLVLDSEQIQRMHATDLSDLFANESSMAVGGGSAVGQKFYVRGLEDALLNVSVDGAAQPANLYHHQTRVQLEPEFIKTIQLDAGAGAATNGPGAITGALKVKTKDAFDMLRDGQDVGAYVKGTAAFNGDNDYKGVASVYGRVSENIGLLATFVRQSGGDYDDGNGNEVTPTAFDHKRGYIKLNGEFDDHTFALTYEDLYDYGTYYERPHFSGWSSRYNLSDHEMNRETLSFNHSFNPLSDLIDTEFTLYTNTSDYSNYINSTGSLYGKGEMDSTGFDLRNSSIIGQHSVTYGVDYRKDELDAEADVRPGLSGAAKQTATVAGLYAQDNWQLHDRLLLSFGARYDRYDHKVDAGDDAGVDNDSSGFSPNLSLEWEVVDGLTIRPAYAKALRGVQIKEAFFSNLYEFTEGLEAEKADNLELGLAYEKDGFFARATFYRQDIDNYIDSVFSGGETWGTWQNVGTLEVEGYEFEVGKQWNDLRLSLGVWDADPELNGSPLTDGNLGEGTTIGRTWVVKADYQIPEKDLDLALVARHVESEPNLISATAPDKESYTVLDIHANWQPLGDDQLTLSLAVDNLFDEAYYDHATYTWVSSAGTYVGFPAKGRSVLLSAAYKF